MDQRKTQRYRLQLPLRILQVGDQRVDRLEKTRDISSGGVCFLSPTAIEVGGRIEYLITLSGSTPAVCIRCLGKILRSRSHKADPEAAVIRTTIGARLDGSHNQATGNGNHSSTESYEVAVTMERYQFVRPEELEALEVVPVH